MKECPFEVGDKVRHKASKEIGIVAGKDGKCLIHGQMEHVRNNLALINGKEPPYGHCQTEYTGFVILDIGFNREQITVEDYLLEKVEE